jgi:hypothetical protein
VCLFTRVGTYVQRGSKFCFVVVVVVLLVLGADTLIRILHYCPISPCFLARAAVQTSLNMFRPISTGFGLRAMHAEIFHVFRVFLQHFSEINKLFCNAICKLFFSILI